MIFLEQGFDFFFPPSTFVSCPSSALTRGSSFFATRYTRVFVGHRAAALNNYDNYAASPKEILPRRLISRVYLHNYAGARESRINVSLIECHRHDATDRCQSRASLTMRYIVVYSGRNKKRANHRHIIGRFLRRKPCVSVAKVRNRTLKISLGKGMR